MGALDVTGLHAYYGKLHALQGIDIRAVAGEVVGVLGRNGAGKTTLLHALMGIVEPERGSIKVAGREMFGQRPHAISRSGVALVPQGRRIFPTLTVEENMSLAIRRGKTQKWSVADVYDFLPRLHARRRALGRQLSGGEQQMLAIGRAVLQDPSIMLLDEPSEGLAPAVNESIVELLKQLRAADLAMVVVEQNVGVAAELCDRVCVIDRGQIVYSEGVEGFKEDPSTAIEYLGLTSTTDE